jgi:ubiquinol-cytochrome c reductase iron-sulfur subunit
LTGRTQHYALLGGARALYASAARLGAIKFVSSMAAAADAVALSTVEVNIGALPVGQSLTVTWRGKPIFVRHRTAAEIAQAAVDDAAELRDPQTDADRVKPGQSEWLVVVGVCTHLGCVPVGDAGDYNGWFCPCHGSHYDTSGRIRKGPAPLNLEVPTYSFSDPKTLIVG